MRSTCVYMQSFLFCCLTCVQNCFISEPPLAFLFPEVATPAFPYKQKKSFFFFFSLQWIKKHKVKHVNKTFSTYRYLYGFEEYCRSANIQFRTIHHNEPKVVEDIQKHEEPMEESVKEEQKMPPTEVKKEAEENYSSSESEKEEIELRSPRVSSSNWFLFST